MKGNADRFDLGVIRSADRGVTWSAPVIVTRMQTVDLIDPITTFTIRPTPDNIPAAAVDPRSGAIYAAWTSGDSAPGKIRHRARHVERQRNDLVGPIKINQTPGRPLAFVPTIAVLDDGTVGVSYFDTRNNSAAPPGLLADHWLGFCRSDCGDATRWAETHIAGPFDLQRAPYAHGSFVGDYMGIVGQGRSFDLLYATSTEPDSSELTAAWFTSVGFGRDP